MKREILFRGKVTKVPQYMQDKNRMAVGDWVYGSYVYYPVAQIFDLEDEYIVDPATVGQYTRLCDKDGKKIFEGDIIKAYDGDVMYVCYGKTFASFGLHKQGWTFLHYFNEAVKPGDCEVIGNIHDTPDFGLEEELE